MAPRALTALDEHLAATGVDGFLIHASGEESDQRYLSGFAAPDPFVTLYDGEVRLLVSSLEYGRARTESDAASVERTADYDVAGKREEYGAQEAGHRVLAEFCTEHDVRSLLVPERFPIGVADGLRAQGLTVEPQDEDVLGEIRAVKSERELEHIRAAQRANDAAMGRVEELLREAEVGERHVLYRGGVPLTAEDVKTEIEVQLLREGNELSETIVACGADAADPHDTGSGPLRANEPIIVDIFPRGKTSKYFADMTRTFVKGTPTPTIEEWYALTQAAKDAAFDVLEPGVTGEAVHDAVCDVYEDADHPTLRSDPTTETGFIHSTGHGVGLDIHEGPRLGPGGEELEPGQVVTIEPGLYDPAHGGVRIEDLAVVTEDGYENLTDYPEALVVE